MEENLIEVKTSIPDKVEAAKAPLVHLKESLETKIISLEEKVMPRKRLYK